MFTSSDEEQYLLDLLEGYLELKPYMDRNIWVDQDFVFAFRIMAQRLDGKELQVALEKWGKVVQIQDHPKDYLRMFEEIINKGKHEKSHIRFF